MRKVTSVLMILATIAIATTSGVNAAADDDDEGATAKLAGDWKLIKLGEDKVPADVEISLSVTAEGKVSGSTGVNSFFGGLAKEKTLFGPLGMTRKAGPPDAMQRESAYTKALSAVTAFAVEGDQLTLSAGDKPRLVFERIKPAQPK
jgi:heat shock protein HslJ